MSDAPSITPRIAQPMPEAMHATDATDATNARHQDTQRNPRVYNRGSGAVDNSYLAAGESFFQSDLDLAVFLATRNPNRVRHEKPRRTAAERRRLDYDRETTNQLSFIYGQQATQTKNGAI